MMEEGGLELELAYFFLMMQTLVVVLEHRRAFCFSAVVFRVCVRDVAGEDFLPEGEAASGAWGEWSALVLEG
jgi:hypothetical protein